MRSTHVYEAALIGDPDVPLSVRDGRIVLDSSRAPHVEARLTIAMPGTWDTDGDVPEWVPDPETLAALDPRLSPRVRITATRDGGTPREFDLGVRRRPIRHADGTVDLELASDEALLQDYAPLDDDETPFTLAASLRDVIDYVLDAAIPGAALEADPDHDADLTPYWEVTNLIRNPAVVTDLTNWAAGGGVTLSFVSAGSSGEVGVTMTDPTGAVFAVDTSKYNIPARPGERYTFSIAQRYVGSLGGSGRAVLRFLDNNDAAISEVEGDAVNMTTSYERVEVTAEAPPSAVKVAPFWRVSGGTGRTYRLDQALLHTSPFPVPPFTGGDADTGGYSYSFEGPSNDSASIRSPDVERDPEALVWRAGVSALDFLHPLVQAAGFRLVCDEQRKWTLRGEDYRASGFLTARFGVNVIDAEDEIDRERGLWFDAAVRRYVWTDRNGIRQERIDAYALNDPPTRVSTVEINAPYPGPGRAEYAVRRAQGRGREVTATMVADWTVHAEQAVSVHLPDAPIQLGITDRVEFDLGTDRMTLATRTTEVSPLAWVLIPEGETWLDSPIGESWIEEEVA